MERWWCLKFAVAVRYFPVAGKPVISDALQEQWVSWILILLQSDTATSRRSRTFSVQWANLKPEVDWGVGLFVAYIRFSNMSDRVQVRSSLPKLLPALTLLNAPIFSEMVVVQVLGIDEGLRLSSLWAFLSWGVPPPPPPPPPPPLSPLQPTGKGIPYTMWGFQQHFIMHSPQCSPKSSGCQFIYWRRSDRVPIQCS